MYPAAPDGIRIATERNILVIDDDVEMATVMGDILKMNNYEVLLAHDGLQGIERSNERRIDLILLDIRMPIFSGFWFCDAFKKRPRTQNVPIVMVSSLSAAETRRKAEEAGAAAFLSKPFRAQELIDTVARVIHPN